MVMFILTKTCFTPSRMRFYIACSANCRRRQTAKMPPPSLCMCQSTSIMVVQRAILGDHSIQWFGRGVVQPPVYLSSWMAQTSRRRSFEIFRGKWGEGMGGKCVEKPREKKKGFGRRPLLFWNPILNVSITCTRLNGSNYSLCNCNCNFFSIKTVLHIVI